MSVGARRTSVAVARPRTRTPVRRHERIEVTGAASIALRPVVEAARRPARVLAVFPLVVYLEVRGDLEPRVLAVITGDATRLPNAVVLSGPLPRVSVGDEAWVGDGAIELGRLSLRVRRWWDPAPALGAADPVRLAAGAERLAVLRARSGRAPGLPDSGLADLLAAGCRSGSLVTAITAAEQLMGLGPGLTPSGDDMLAGALAALRHLGAATRTGRAVWLADWLAATVAFDARTRTTPISATLLHCAAQGQLCAEAAGVLRGLAGLQPLEPALHRLLQLGHTSGADLAWGIGIGLEAVLRLSQALSEGER